MAYYKLKKLKKKKIFKPEKDMAKYYGRKHTKQKGSQEEGRKCYTMLTYR